MGKYYLGLDMGTDSVGWAVTDEEFNIVRKGGKSLWGVRLFDAANPAAERRMNRTNRRRLQRRRQRITLLQEIFFDEVNKVDPMFFRKLELSKYHFEDRQQYFSSKTLLFNDDGFTDKEYFKRYPTIYHLRKALIEEDKKFDIRLIYLAIHHLIKYRGNFLMDGDFDINGDQFENQLTTVNEVIKTINSETELDSNKVEIGLFDTEKAGEIRDAFINGVGIKRTEEELLKVMPTKSDYFKKVICKLLSGGTVKCKDIFDGSEKEYETDKISFSSDFDETFEKVCEENSEDRLHCELLKELYNLYSILTLKKLLNNCEYLCDAMCNIYDEHKKDLQELKAYVNENCPEKKDRIFRECKKDLNNYAKYVGSNSVGGEVKRFSKCSAEDFYRFLKKELDIEKVSKNDEYLSKISEKMNNGTFLQKQNSTGNGIFPYQLNKKELKKIIENQSKYYSFFQEYDEENEISTEGKIISLLEFKIPYYVGPLNGNKDSNYWMKRSEEGKIYPWNFDKKVDKAKSAEEFIRRMQNKCTYLHDKFTLPKDSIIFQKYVMYNTLNKMNINDKPITVEQKKSVIDDLFNKKIVKKKDLEEYVKEKYDNGILTTSTGKPIEAIQFNQKSLLDFNRIFGEQYVKDNLDTIEDIIRDIAIFEDKDILVKRLRTEYNIQDENKIKQIKKLKYSGFARLSKELLCDLKIEMEKVDTGELIDASIMYLLENTNMNFMEILNYDDQNGKKPFIELINAENDDNNADNVEDFISKQYVSPGMKRALIQAYKIIDEIETKILKQKIDTYFIESTRTDKSEKGDKGRKNSRLDDLKAKYKEIKDICETEKLEELRNQLDKDSDADKYRSDKLYLYLLQMGKSMYSQKPIEMKDLYDTSVCDIDHIVPQSILKDDSIENRVLVFQDENREKRNIYPIPEKFRTSKQIAFYKNLKKYGLIGEKKYNLLTRNTELTEDEINKFEARQLVYTSQSVKALAETLRKYKGVEDSNIVLVKGERVSEFRKENDILKCRSINDLHHAYDAYLNVVVGQCLYKSGGNRLVTRSAKLKEYVGKVKEQIQKSNYRHDILVTTRQYVGSSIMNKISIQPNKDNGSSNAKELYPLKNSGEIRMDPEKYGGYTALSNGYYCVVKSKDKKGNVITSIEPMQTIFVKVDAPIEEKEKYLREEVGLIDPKIQKDKDGKYIDNLKINFIIENGNSRYCITGKTADYLVIKCISEPYYSNEFIHSAKKIDKILGKITENKLKIEKENFEKIKEKIKVTGDGKTVIVNTANGYTVKEDELLTDSEIIAVYDALIQQMGKNIYEAYSNLKSIYKELINQKDLFLKLNIFEKIKVVTEIIKLLSCKRFSADLRLIGLKEKSGVLTLGKKNFKGCIVTESITGFYKKVIFDGGK